MWKETGVIKEAKEHCDQREHGEPRQECKTWTERAGRMRRPWLFTGVNTQKDQGVNHVGIMTLASQMNLFLL